MSSNASAVDVQVANDIYVDFVGDQHITLNIVEEVIEIGLEKVGPPGSGHGILLTDYSVRTVYNHWTGGIGLLNLDQGNSAYAALQSHVVLSEIVGWPGVGEEGKLTLYVRQDGVEGNPYTITWPSNILWVNTEPPQVQIEPSAWDIFIFTSPNSGADVFGFHVGRTFKGV